MRIPAPNAPRTSSIRKARDVYSQDAEYNEQKGAARMQRNERSVECGPVGKCPVYGRRDKVEDECQCVEVRGVDACDERGERITEGV